ncbi:MAG: hypothetical protein AB7G06_04130 [Bdellovibrionales bacterium]
MLKQRATDQHPQPLRTPEESAALLQKFLEEAVAEHSDLGAADEYRFIARHDRDFLYSANDPKAKYQGTQVYMSAVPAIISPRRTSSVLAYVEYTPQSLSYVPERMVRAILRHELNHIRCGHPPLPSQAFRQAYRDVRAGRISVEAYEEALQEHRRITCAYLNNPNPPGHREKVEFEADAGIVDEPHELADFFLLARDADELCPAVQPLNRHGHPSLTARIRRLRVRGNQANFT